MPAPIDVFDTIFYRTILRYQRIVGYETLTTDYRPHAWTWFTNVLNISFVVLNFYTLAYFETTVRLKCLSISGIGLQGLCKIPTTLYYAADLHDLVAFLRTIYASNRLRVLPAYPVLRQHSGRMLLVLRIGTAMILFCSSMYVPVCFLESWLAGHRVPMMNTMVPGVQIDGDGHWPEYAMVYVYHLVLLFFGSIGTCAFDLLLIMLVMHLSPMSVIFAQLLGKLNDTLRLANRARESAIMFRNILQVHKELTGYIRSIATIYYYVFLVGIYTDSLSLCVLLVSSVKINWIGIYPLFVLFLFKLFVSCFLGTLVELSTDRVYEALLQCEWMELGLQQRKLFLIMLFVAQSPAKLMAGPVPLNLDTFVNLMRAVYSAGMLLLKVVS